MFADRRHRKNSISTGSCSKKMPERGYFGYYSGERRNDVLSGKIARDNLNLRSGVRIYPDAGLYSKAQSLSGMGVHHQQDRVYQGLSRYTTFTRSHNFFPHRCANRKVYARGLGMNDSCTPSFRGQHCIDAVRGPALLMGKGFSYSESLKLQGQKQVEHNKKPFKKLELLGHTEEKMRELILSKATRTPFRYFNLDVEFSNSRFSSADCTSRNLTVGFSSPSAEQKFFTKYNNQVLQHRESLHQSNKKLFLPSLNPESSSFSTSADDYEKIPHPDQYILGEDMYYCPEDEDEMTDLEGGSSSEEEEEEELPLDSEDTLGGKLEHCNNAEKQVTTSETGSENDKEEGEGEDIEDQDEMEEEDMLFEEELEEEEEEEMVEGEISRVVFKRASLNRDISDVSDQFSKSILQESVRGEDDSITSSHFTLSPPQLPIHSRSSELTSLRELSDPHLKTKEGQATLPLSSSLFPKHIHPSIHFPLLNEQYTPLSSKQQSLLKYKNSTITPNIVKSCLSRVGYSKSSGGNLWTVYWGKHMRVESFKNLKEYQKVNHFPGTFQIGRKDRLWRNLSKMAGRCGKKDCDFFPQTFVLPHDTLALKKIWEENGGRQKWIIKPPASARGIGIKVINNWMQVPKKKSVIVQRYLSNPYLINGMKFDLRVYVYVTSYDPLRIYVYREGLARFATCKYSSAMRHISNKYMHLTNYSINKHNSEFTANTDETVCQGHKWGLLALWKYMNTELGIDTDVVWESIKDVIVKTIISSEDYISFCVRAYVKNSSCVHELFGFDILLDRHLKPWVLEVNISPSLHSNSPLDVNIKGRLVRDMFNIASLKLHSRDVLNGIKSIPRQLSLTPADKLKHAKFLQRGLTQEDRKQICDYLTNDDMRVLMISEDERSKCGAFECAFPTVKYDDYRRLFENEKYYNILLGEWAIKYERYHQKGIEVLQKLADDLQLQVTV